MEQDKKYTDVIFYRDKQGRWDIFAYFPKEQFANDPKIKTSYAHIGQHSACHVDYVKEQCTVVKNPEEYKDLFNELENIGYKLKVKFNHSVNY